MASLIMNDHAVTWLLPVRNGMPYLPITLASIARQTYQNFTVIAWDNGSKDGTLEVLHQWIGPKLPGVLVSDRPLGLGASMAAMVEMARTELCAVIHGDDINVESRLDRQVTFLKDHPNAVLVGTQVNIIDETGCSVDSWSNETDDAELRWLTKWKTRFCHPSVMFRRTAVRAAGNYRDNAPVEDADLWIRLSSYGELHNLNEKLLNYRRTATSQTGKVADWMPFYRRAAQANAAEIFPNISDEQAAMDLWEITHPSPEVHALPTRRAHSTLLRQAAVQFARKSGKPDEYFLKPSTHRDQQYCLRRRMMDRFGLSPLLRLREYLAAARGA